MGVNIDIPKDPNATKIRIEGPTEGVLRAKAEIDAMIKKLKDEVSLDVVIEQRFHRQIIGKSGESIKEVLVHPLRNRLPIFLKEKRLLLNRGWAP
jgi:hypothetical protein